MVPLLVILGVVVLAVLFVVGIYNSLVQMKVSVQNAWSQIDVQLKRRIDLIHSAATLLDKCGLLRSDDP